MSLKRKLSSIADSDCLPALPYNGSLAPCASALRRFALWLENETKLLSRLLYRGSNQHRRAKWWNAVKGVQRIAGRLAEEMLPVKAIFEDVAASKNPMMAQDRTNAVIRLLRAHLIVDEARKIIAKAYLELRRIVSLDFFLPLVLSILAVVSRLDAISAFLQAELPRCQRPLIRDLTVTERTAFKQTLPVSLRAKLLERAQTATSGRPFTDEEVGERISRDTLLAI